MRRAAVEQHVTSAVFFGLGDRYAWCAITFLAAWAGRLRDTPYGRDPPAIDCPVLMPREHEREERQSSSTSRR